MVQSSVVRGRRPLLIQELTKNATSGTGFPDSLLLSLKAFAATGLWNQLSKVWHAIYVSWYMIPFWRSCRPAAARSRVYNFLRTLKQNEAKDLPMGTAGFCWGGKFVTELCWDQEQNKTEAGTRVTVCGYVAHPSLLEIPGDIDNITLPYSCAAAELDHLMSPDKAKEMQEVLQTKAAKMKDRGVDYGFVTYPGVEHGFAIRADENDTHAAEQGKKAEKQAVEWFERWFSNPPPS